MISQAAQIASCSCALCALLSGNKGLVLTTVIVMMVVSVVTMVGVIWGCIQRGRRIDMLKNRRCCNAAKHN